MAYSKTSTHDKKAVIIGTMLMIFVGVYFVGRSFLKNDKESSQSTTQPITEEKEKNDDTLSIAPDVLLKKMQNGDKIKIIDVRTETAFGNGHIAHALFLPIGSLANLSLEKDEIAVIVLSESDLQTVEAAKNILKQKSFPYFFLKGGLEGWSLLGAPLISSGDPNSFIDQSKVTYIELEAFKKLSKENSSMFFLLDVQTKEDYQKKHIVGALHIPLEELEKRSSEIPVGRSIIVYGENDAVSFQGGVRLADLGVFTAQTLIGNKYLSPDSGLTFEP